MSEFNLRTPRERRKHREQLLQGYEGPHQRNRLARPGRHRFLVVLNHLKAGYEIARIFRSAGACGGAEVQRIDLDPFDPAPAKGAFKQVPARFAASFDDADRDLTERGYQLCFFDHELDSGLQLWASTLGSTRHRTGGPAPRATPLLTATDFPLRSAFVLGHEARGLSLEPGDHDRLSGIRIRQSGQVESLNVGIAASLAI